MELFRIIFIKSYNAPLINETSSNLSEVKVYLFMNPLSCFLLPLTHKLTYTLYLEYASTYFSKSLSFSNM